MAVTARQKLDARALRADFPIFEQLIHGKPLAYLDSANSSQKPRQVLDAMTTFYETSYANVHRAVHVLGERATAGLEGAREKVRALLNAPDVREIIFVRNATEALNLVAYSWGGNNLGPGDAVVVTELEHHSNFVPWQYIAKRNGAEFRMLPIDDNGDVDPAGLDEIARECNVKVVATNLVSNSLGTISDLAPLVRWAHEHGAIFVCDAAQAAPHLRVDVQALDCDFLAISGHKMCGPSGIGALWGRGGAAARDGAVPARRPHDQLGAVREDDVGRAAAQVRGGHVADRGGGRPRRRRRLPRGRGPRRDRGARARARRVRARPARARFPASRSTARRRSGAPASSRSTSTASIRTTSRRSSTGRASPSAPATTAASR